MVSVASDVAHAFFLLLSKKKFPKPKLSNTEAKLTEKKPHDSETKKMQTCTFFFYHNTQYSTDHLVVVEAHHPTTLYEIAL